MNAALRHVRQSVHEAKNLAPPSVHPRLFSQFPKNDGRADTFLQATQLPQKGDLNICHLLDVMRQRVRAQCPPNLCTIRDRGHHQGIEQSPHHGHRFVTHQPSELCLQLGAGSHSILGQSFESRRQAARFMKDQAKILEAGRLRQNLAANMP